MTKPRPSVGVVRSMKGRVIRDVATSQIAFALFIAICVALHPGEVLKGSEGGLSNYGVHLETAVAYTLALALASAFSYRATRSLHTSRRATRHFKVLLLVYSALTLLTLVTTYGYTLDTPQRDLHVAVGVAVTLFECAATLWMYYVVRQLVLVVVTGLTGLVLAVLTFFAVLHVLFLTQVLIGGAFALLLVRTSRELA
ncbi:MAG TPA: hypothetical protein VGZ68_01430 [Acidimicrobiales bacterium]|nr:hypothetical protein [Acidimicrobiales bacterium]